MHKRPLYCSLSKMLQWKQWNTFVYSFMKPKNEREKPMAKGTKGFTRLSLQALFNNFSVN